jgi:hypothetical protein
MPMKNMGDLGKIQRCLWKSMGKKRTKVVMQLMKKHERLTYQRIHATYEKA